MGIVSFFSVHFPHPAYDLLSRTEMWTILMVGCIPPIRPLMVKAIHKIQSSSGWPRETNDISLTPGYGQSRSYTSRSIKRPAQTATNESEEDILAEGNGIVMTRKVSIHYEESRVAFHSGDLTERVAQ